MRKLNNLLNMHHISVEIQGNHGVKPPVKELHRVINTWLLLNNPTLESQFYYTLQVQCRRIPARTSNGDYVWALYRAKENPCAIVVRILPAKSEWQWSCHLVCESKDLVSSILARTNPEAAHYLERNREIMGVINIESTRPIISSDKMTQKYNAAITQRKSMLRHFGKRINQREFCAKMVSIVTATNDQTITLDTLKKGVAAVYRPVNGDELKHLCCYLILMGLIHPKSDNSDDQFRATLLFGEMALTYHEDERIKHLESLDRKKIQCIKKRKSLGDERQRLLDQILKIDSTFPQIDDEISLIEKEIKKNSGEFPSNLI